MNANARKWVKALRSGKYEQARGALRVEDAFCCLGVACDISGLGKWEEYRLYQQYLGQQIFLPHAVKEWLGLQDCFGSLSHPWSLAALNDSGRSFNEIADIIEGNSEKLFKMRKDQ